MEKSEQVKSLDVKSTCSKDEEFNGKDFVFPRVAELLIHKEKSMR